MIFLLFYALGSLYLTVCECYILSIPSHVLVDVGSDANFTCQSSIVNGISWYFTRVEKSQNEKHRLYLDYVNKSASSVGFFVFNSADQRTSTLHLSEVKDHYSGTYTCADANDAAFADLTVVPAGHSGGLTLCPTDVITTSGEFVYMPAAGIPGSSLRWYRNSLDHAGGNTVIFTGKKMDYKQVDERFSVAFSREEEKTLVIRDVYPSDAGLYTVREQFSGHPAHADLVVIEPNSLRCQRQAVSVLGVDVEMVCELKYKGRIQPTLQWLVDGKDKPVNGTLRDTGTDGKVESRLTVSPTDPAVRTTKCQVSFSRQSCSQPRLAYTRTVKCHSNDDVEKINFVELFKRRPDFLAYAVAALLSTLVLLRVLELVCTRMCKSSGKRKVPEYDERQTFPFKYATLHDPASVQSRNEDPPYATIVNDDPQPVISQ